MRRLVIVATVLGLGAGSVRAADSSSGHAALALAGLVGLHAPTLSAGKRAALASMLEGKLAFAFPANGTIKVVAKAVTCRASNVDISEHDCTLDFGGALRRLDGRTAHELFATLIENGVASDGAAGSEFEAVSNLSCTVKPAEVKAKAGGGATCTFTAGPGS